jgi:micrococcal nuclease
MKRNLLILCLVLLLPTLCFGWSGKVVGVADGDTITVLDTRDQNFIKAVKIRLYGVDSPEKAQDFGNKAKQFTSDLVFGKNVEVDEITTDIFKRTVAKVTVEGKSLNEELLKAGFAWWYVQYAKGETRYKELEEKARQEKIGLWSHPDPTPPWLFRKEKKKKK